MKNQMGKLAIWIIVRKVFVGALCIFLSSPVIAQEVFPPVEVKPGDSEFSGKFNRCFQDFFAALSLPDSGNVWRKSIHSFRRKIEEISLSASSGMNQTLSVLENRVFLAKRKLISPVIVMEGDSERRIDNLFDLIIEVQSNYEKRKVFGSDIDSGAGKVPVALDAFLEYPVDGLAPQMKMAIQGLQRRFLDRAVADMFLNSGPSSSDNFRAILFFLNRQEPDWRTQMAKLALLIRAWDRKASSHVYTAESGERVRVVDRLVDQMNDPALFERWLLRFKSEGPVNDSGVAKISPRSCGEIHP
ncbi:MAG: hypothetical protein C5B49_02395 [Bdellovibrio sp.]|nr:MAG: hypothetical protein C5B49_02395 [Bdellovibrio sp.]